MNGSSVVGLFFVETLSNTLQGSKKTREKLIQRRICVSFLISWWCVIHKLYFWWPMTLRKWEKRTFLFFPESCLFNLLVLGGFLWFTMVCFFSVWLLVIEEVHVWWFMESDIFFLMISQACKIWMMKFYPLSQWLGCCPNDLDVVPKTWMLSQVGQYPELSQLLHSMFQPQNLMPICFSLTFSKGGRKNIPTHSQEKTWRAFFWSRGWKSSY